MDFLSIAARTLASKVAAEIVKRAVGSSLPGAQLSSGDRSVAPGRLLRGGRSGVVNRKVLRDLVRDLVLEMAKTEHDSLRISYEDGDRVVEAVVETLVGRGDLTMDDVQAHKLDPARMAEHLRLSAGDDVAALVAAPARPLYDLLLVQCCTQLVDHFSGQPSFSARTQVETTQMLSEIDRKLSAATSTLLQRLDDLDGDVLRRMTQFEQRYRESARRELSSIRLFGLQSGELRYQLAPTYVNLSLVGDVADGDGSVQPEPARAGGRALDAARTFSITDAIAITKRLVIEGPAGSGKSTITRWVALQCLNDAFSSDNSWNHCVPFLLQLRKLGSYSGFAAPSPDAFVNLTVGPLGDPPAGWTSTILEIGRSIVLIDGVDEVQEDGRNDVLDWLEQLIDHYPDAHYVITSRPAAVRGAWRNRLARFSFVHAGIEPMNPIQVETFVERWHQSGAHPTLDTVTLTQAGRALLSALSRRRDLSELATTPLLCAMLCALNVSNNEYLPSGRIALYEDALTMLLERRERQSKINAFTIPVDRHQLLPLVANIAFWMLLNGQRTIERRIALRELEERMSNIRSSELTPESVLTYLVERSGVLQALSVDLLEFIHPSVQDFLAAGEVLRRNFIGHAIKLAHDPLYHDVIIMAIGIAQGEDQRQRALLEGLLARAKAEPGPSRTLWLLAAASISDIGWAPADLAAEIDDAMREIIPPRDLDEAASLANAGSFIVDLLSDLATSNALSTSESLATIRVASLTKSTSGFKLARAFIKHPSRELRLELVNTWTQLRGAQSRRFATEVLRNANLSDLEVVCANPDQVVGLQDLYQLRQLAVACDLEETKMRVLARATQIERLRFSGARIWTVAPLRNLDRLTDVEFVRGARLLARATLSGLAGVERLTMHGIWVGQMPFERLTRLRHLDLADCTDVARAVARSRDLPSMRTLALPGSDLRDVDPVADLVELRELDVRGCWVDVSRVVSSLPLLETLRLGASPLADVEAVSALPRLRELHVADAELASLSFLAGIQTLEHVIVSEGQHALLERVPWLHPVDVTTRPAVG